MLERCSKIQSRSATNNEVLMKHTQETIDLLKSTSNLQDVNYLETMSSKFDAVYFHPVNTFINDFTTTIFILFNFVCSH